MSPLSTSCPVCGSHDLDAVMQAMRVPTFCNKLQPTREAALAVTRGDLDMRLCRQCAHFFNAALLDRDDNGDFRALMIVGDGEAKEDNRSEDKRKLNRYGWGERIEEWISQDDGATWAFNRDITPVKGYRYQNLKRVSTGMGESSNDIVLFYGWKPDAVPGEAVAYLWDDR